VNPDGADNLTRAYSILEKEFSLSTDEPMAQHTSFKVGGAADLFAAPSSRDELIGIVNLARKLSVPVTLMGRGTNLLILDKGIRGLVVSTRCVNEVLSATRVSEAQTLVTASSGVVLATLARFTIKQRLDGFGFAAGIPGTVGGAVMMNAGTAQGTISEHLASLEILTRDGNVQTVDRSELLCFHRQLLFKGFPPGQIVLAGNFLLPDGDKTAMEACWLELLEKRHKSQPERVASAGCFFKNPDREQPAGFLIDRAGLKGARCGNAMVSNTHANFIVNLGGATAKEILTLKTMIENEVKKKFNVDLKPEVKIEGE